MSQETKLEPSSCDNNVEEVPLIEIDDPPDGGLLAWLQVVAGVLCSFNSWGVVNAYGLFQSYYGRNGILEDATESQIAWIGALSGAVTHVGASLFGGLLDAGYIKHLALGGCFAQAFALMMLSLSTKYWHFIICQGLLVGLSASVLFLVSIAAVGPYFSTKRSLAIGISSTGSALGAVVYAGAGRTLLDNVGFPWGARALGFIELGTGLIAWVLIKRRLPPMKRTSYFASEALKEPAFMLFAIGQMIAFLAMYIFYFHYQRYAQSLDPDNKVYLYITAILNAAAVLGRVFPSWLADHVGPFNVLLPVCLLSGMLSFCWLRVKDQAGVIALCVIFGVVTGAVTAFPGTITARFTKDLRRLGVRLSFVLMVASLGFVFGPPFAGIMIREHSYDWAIVYCGCAWFVSSACLLACYFIQTGGRLRRFL